MQLPYPAQGPVFLHVSRDPEGDWRRVLSHVLRMAEVYGGWQSEAPGQKPGPFAGKPSEEALRASPAYRVLSPEGVLELVDDLGSDATLLLCGLDPASAWESLGLF